METAMDSSTMNMMEHHQKTSTIPITYYIKNILKYTLAVLIILSAFLILLSSFISILVFVLYNPATPHVHSDACEEECHFKIVETLPANLNLNRIPGTNTTFEILKELLSNAKESILISSNFFNLKNQRLDGKMKNSKLTCQVGGSLGNELFNILENIKTNNKELKIEILQQISTTEKLQNETKYLMEKGVFDQVVDIEISKTYEDGILNSKFLIVDEESSSDFTWQSLSNVKELGIFIEHCHCLGHDLEKIFNLWKYFGRNLKNTLPADVVFPGAFETEINDEHPGEFTHNNETVQFCKKIILTILDFGISPKNIKTPERSSEIVALLEMIEKTKKSLSISIAEIYPFDSHFDSIWNEIENALRVAILRNIDINILVSKTNHTNSYMIPSLNAIKSFATICQNDHTVCNGTFNVKLIEFPTPNQDNFKESYVALNNPKFVISDEETIYISNSDWNQNSFYKNFGIGFWIKQADVVNTMKLIFDRDYNSVYVTNL